ncbi:MAG: hypothetical protein AB7G17_07260 [Phycisphaerales bacterium]
MTTTNAKPIDTIRDGSLKATIWKNAGEKGDYYSVRITRTWRDDQGNYHDSDSFSGSELLRVARLASMAYDRSAERRNGGEGGAS